MKFTRFNCDSQVLYIEIKSPEEHNGITYYYPDGLTRGLFKKKTYIASSKNFFSHCDDFYESLEDIIKGNDDLTILDGRIYKYGRVSFIVKNIETPFVFKYTSIEELKEYLENLSFKYSFPLQNFVSLEDKNLISLYEYKESLG
jgi:hypothetical protein